MNMDSHHAVVGSPERLIHYRPLWDERLETARASGEGPVAVLVCHGMGQQVRYETISSVAAALLAEARARGAALFPVEVTLSEANDDFLPRAEVKWTTDARKHEVHIYEAYWAPLTEGKVTYWETIKFLLRAGCRGLKASLPFWPNAFDRWIFGGRKSMRIGPLTFIGLLAVLAALLLQVAIIAVVSLTLAVQWKLALGHPFPSFGNHFLCWLKECLLWLAAFVPGSKFGELRNWQVVRHMGIWVLLTAEAFAIRYFVVQFVGDVAAYISPYKDSKFDELRHQIRNVGLNVGKVIYGFDSKLSKAPDYERVVLVGHSLGSVLAYDTLNSLINEDQVRTAHKRRDVLGRTKALITCGSPLDKTAFMFRLQARKEEQWIREQLAASVQPLIVDYSYRQKLDWINLWSPMDIISGAVNYYDDPGKSPTDPECVQNAIDWGAWVPFYAHVQYWHSKRLRKSLYDHVS